MATLTTNEKQILEKLFQMGSGYVLTFSDRTIVEFFKDDVGVNIFDERYNYASGSKANRLRGFWQTADDTLVGKSIDKLIEYIDNQILLGNLEKEEFPPELVRRGLAARLRGGKAVPAVPVATEDEFISKEFGTVSVDKLGLDPVVGDVLKQRLDEIRKCLTAQAPLALGGGPDGTSVLALLTRSRLAVGGRLSPCLRQGRHLAHKALGLFGFDAQLAEDIFKGLPTTVENLYAFFIGLRVNSITREIVEHRHGIWLSRRPER
jgi:hypothetical protein